MFEFIHTQRNKLLVATAAGALLLAGCSNKHGQEVQACEKDELTTPVVLGSHNQNDAHTLIDYNHRLSQRNTFQDSTNNGGGDPLDKIGEIVCFNPSKPEKFYFNHDGMRLRETYIVDKDVVTQPA